MICLTGGHFLGWRKFDNVYDISNNIDSAVYSFARVKEVPQNNLLPFNLKETFYIGESGGQESTWDQKDKNTGRGRLETSFHKRCKQHQSNLLKRVRETFEYDEFVAVAIFVPNDTIKGIPHACKQWQKSAESELILYYSLMFGNTTEYNLAHMGGFNNKKVKSDSISHKKILEMKEMNLVEKFLND
jgi:hypothetical protein